MWRYLIRAASIVIQLFKLEFFRFCIEKIFRDLSSPIFYTGKYVTPQEADPHRLDNLSKSFTI